MKKLRVAIIGQGRSGKDIHGAFFLTEKNEWYDVAYVVDADERRRNIALERHPGCKVFADYKDILDKKDIDLVVNATFSYMHYAITKDLLEHKFNVLVEKPFARNQYECSDLINTAKENGVLLAVFQQTFYAPYYQDALKLIESGRLGKIYQISIRFNGFARRWDWQTLQKKMGGNAYNTGPHPFGMALGFLDFDDAAKIVYTKLGNTAMSSGDADDYCKVIIDTPNKPVIDLEINNTDCFRNYNIKFQGDKGCFKATPAAYQYRYIVDGENPERPVIEKFLQDENGNPLYCSENLEYHEEKGAYPGTAFNVGTQLLYENLYYALTEGKEMYIDAEKVKKIVGIIETAHAENDLPVLF
jgi:predicted dehydrogenase